MMVSTEQQRLLMEAVRELDRSIARGRQLINEAKLRLALHAGHLACFGHAREIETERITEKLTG